MELINQTVRQQIVPQGLAACYQNILAGLAFEFGNLLVRICTPDNAGIGQCLFSWRFPLVRRGSVPFSAEKTSPILLSYERDQNSCTHWHRIKTGSRKRYYYSREPFDTVAHVGSRCQSRRPGTVQFSSMGSLRKKCFNVEQQ